MQLQLHEGADAESARAEAAARRAEVAAMMREATEACRRSEEEDASKAAAASEDEPRNSSGVAETEAAVRSPDRQREPAIDEAGLDDAPRVSRPSLTPKPRKISVSKQRSSLPSFEAAQELVAEPPRDVAVTSDAPPPLTAVADTPVPLAGAAARLPTATDTGESAASIPTGSLGPVPKPPPPAAQAKTTLEDEAPRHTGQATLGVAADIAVKVSSCAGPGPLLPPGPSCPWAPPAPGAAASKASCARPHDRRLREFGMLWGGAYAQGSEPENKPPALVEQPTDDSAAANAAIPAAATGDSHVRPQGTASSEDTVSAMEQPAIRPAGAIRIISLSRQKSSPKMSSPKLAADATRPRALTALTKDSTSDAAADATSTFALA